MHMPLFWQEALITAESLENHAERELARRSSNPGLAGGIGFGSR